MTSSDRTELDPEWKDRLSRRVGTTIEGTTTDGTTTDGSPIDGTVRAVSPGIRVGLACAEFNGGITARLLDGALDVLEEAGGDLPRSVVVWAPGAFELPMVALGLARSGAVDAVIALGAVIRGDTGHYDFVAGECAAGLQRVQLDTGVPVVFGVLTCDTEDQALVRSEPDESNKGREAAWCALSMGAVLERVTGVGGPRLGFSAGGR